MLKMAILRHELKKLSPSNIDKADKSNDDDPMAIGDVITSMYGQVLDRESDQAIIEDLEKSCEFCCLESNDSEHDLVTSEDVNLIKTILAEYFDILGLKKATLSPTQNDAVKELLTQAWALLNKGHLTHLLKVLNAVSASEEANKETYEARVIKAETDLLKGHLALIQCQESPLDLGYSALKTSQSVLAHFDRNQSHDLKSIGLWIKAMNLSSKARNFSLDVSFQLGLGREMRMYAKLSLDIGLEIVLLENLCKQLLCSVEADLYCDDAKQGQTKLREVENLLKDKLKSDKPLRVAKSKADNKGSKSRKVLPNLDDEEMCASPALAKAFFGLPETIEIDPEIIVKYFTFQGVVWHLEQDHQAMAVYFDLVLNLGRKMLAENKASGRAFLPAFKWIFESFAHTEQFEQCKVTLDLLKEWILRHPNTFWISTFKNCCVALDLALASIDGANVEPSPVKLGMELYDLAVQSRTPEVAIKAQSLEKQQKRPKKAAYPTGANLDVKKLEALSLDDSGEQIPEILVTDEDRFKTPLKTRKTKAKTADEDPFKTPIRKGGATSQTTTSTAKRTTRSTAKSSTTKKSSSKTPLRLL